MIGISKLQEQLLKIRQNAEEREAQKIAQRLEFNYLDLTTVPIKVDVLKLVPEETARRLKLAPFELRKPHLALAIYDPDNPEVKKILKKFKDQGFEVKIFVSSLRGLEHIWSFYKFVVPEKAPITSRVNIEKDRIIQLSRELTDLKNVSKEISEFNFDDLSVTEFLEIVLAGGLSNGVSDIHFEPTEKAVKLRYRIDGLLHDIVSDLSKDFYPSVISRIKLLSNLKINIQDRPQDGRFTIGLVGKDIEIRLAIAPSEFGEIMVMRILDPDAINLSLEQLGLRADDLEIIQKELKKPHGMVLNTGPTGSGKTTTLYAFLKSQTNTEVKIITIEDPIEYHLGGIEQTQVDEEAGYTFANGLRSIMRQDPDIILVGEVRDKDTAEIAIQAALTGHLVFSTVHANEAAGAIPRFLDLGVKPSSISPALNLIIAQRLVRRLCENCRIPVSLTNEYKERIKKFISKLPSRINRQEHESVKLFKPKGCEKCNHLGYRGRIAIFELLTVGVNIQEMIMKDTSEVAIQEFALSHGMVTTQQDGILKAINGITTFEEIESVTGLINWPG